jgi:hypothetical protein
MALWIPVTLDLSAIPLATKIHLGNTQVDIEQQANGYLVFEPKSSKEAHLLALAFRKTARRFEEIGLGLK